MQQQRDAVIWTKEHNHYCWILTLVLEFDKYDGLATLWPSCRGHTLPIGLVLKLCMQSLILKSERSTGYICGLADTFAKCDVVI